MKKNNRLLSKQLEHYNCFNFWLLAVTLPQVQDMGHIPLRPRGYGGQVEWAAVPYPSIHFSRSARKTLGTNVIRPHSLSDRVSDRIEWVQPSNGPKRVEETGHPATFYSEDSVSKKSRFPEFRKKSNLLIKQSKDYNACCREA